MAVAAHHGRGVEPGEAVDEARPQQAGGEAGAALGQHPRDAAPGQGAKLIKSGALNGFNRNIDRFPQKNDQFPRLSGFMRWGAEVPEIGRPVDVQIVGMVSGGPAVIGKVPYTPRKEDEDA